MQREITGQLAVWQQAKERKPLLVTGVRQCGKTYIIQEFGRTHFARLCYFNLEKDELAADAFAYDYDVKRIVKELAGLAGTEEMKPGETLLFLDEIQACPRAVTAMKYFCEDLRELHVICAGSLLGVALKHQNISFPVGKIDRLQMYPMSFAEFLQADEEGRRLAGLLANYALDRTLTEACRSAMTKLYKIYLMVGGMPEAVARWQATRDLTAVQQVQDNILEDYASDFAKHAPLNIVPRLQWIWDSVPKQLAKENNKFVFSQVKAGRRAHELEDALTWLAEAGLVYRTELVSEPQLPLAFAANGAYFKVYMADVGLLCRRAKLDYQNLWQNDGLLSGFRGALTENYVHNELLQQKLQPYFWRSGNTAEVDFVFASGADVVPVEVKAAENVRAKSFGIFCKRYKVKKGFKLTLKNVASNETEGTQIINLPLYLLWRIKLY